MANAKKCDRCGVLYEFYQGIKHGQDTKGTKIKKSQSIKMELIRVIECDANAISVPKAYPTSTHCNECVSASRSGEPGVACCHILDLCPNCMQEFVNFLKEKEETNGNSSEDN